MLKQRIFEELDEHLNNGCVDSRCEVSLNGEFSDTLLEHLAEVLVEVFEEEE